MFQMAVLSALLLSATAATAADANGTVSVGPVNCFNGSGDGNIVIHIEGEAAAALLAVLKPNGRDKALKEIGLTAYSSRDGKLVCDTGGEGLAVPYLACSIELDLAKSKIVHYTICD